MKTLKDAMKQALKEMNLAEIPPPSTPARHEFVVKVLRIMRSEGEVQRKISKLEDFP
ncbi:MAG: hypothetical protein RE469_00750 [Cuniculiplasma divulgatum]|nr:MAG: hypothetical protein RE469_00750 [Cuniculiplasma divulgatum]